MLTLKEKMLLLFRGNRRNSLVIYTAADNTSTFDPSWVFSDASVMTVDWGDGSARESHATALSHTYANGSTKAVKFSCPAWSKVTSFDIRTDVCKFALPSVSRLNKLTYWNSMDNQLSGTPSSFAFCTLLQYCSLQINQFVGILPKVATCTALISFVGFTNQFSNYEAGGFATQKNLMTLHLGTNNLPVAAIDAILADLVTSLGIGGRVTCAVNLSGVGNAAPSNPAGLASKATLVAAWGAGNVTTN